MDLSNLDPFDRWVIFAAEEPEEKKKDEEEPNPGNDDNSNNGVPDGENSENVGDRKEKDDSSSDEEKEASNNSDNVKGEANGQNGEQGRLRIGQTDHVLPVVQGVDVAQRKQDFPQRLLERLILNQSVGRAANLFIDDD